MQLLRTLAYLSPCSAKMHPRGKTPMPLGTLLFKDSGLRSLARSSVIAR